MKPRVFIGSSTKGLGVAEAVQKKLSDDAFPVLWSDGVFRQTNVPIEVLMQAVEQYDFAVFIFLPEDSIVIRDEEAATVRDNVIFELGLFLGKLGRQRTYFLAPRPEPGKKTHLPSDLSGLSPATYDPPRDRGNPAELLAAVGAALYDFKQSIRSLGAMERHQRVVYDSKEDFRPSDFRHRNGCFWKGKEAISERSEGSLYFMDDGVLKLERSNTEGRYEIELRREGARVPTVPKEPDRCFVVRCEMKVDRGEHPVRFVFKDIAADKWAQDELVQVSSTEWKIYERTFHVWPGVDILFRIDHEKPTLVPSQIFFRNLVIVEKI